MNAPPAMGSAGFAGFTIAFIDTVTLLLGISNVHMPLPYDETVMLLLFASVTIICSTT